MFDSELDPHTQPGWAAACLGKGVYTVNEIAARVAHAFRVPRDVIFSKERHKSQVQARFVAMYLARKTTRRSYPELGADFGNHHHTSVMHAVSVVEGWIRSDPKMRYIVQRLELELES